jgi:hypothetical protein
VVRLNQLRHFIQSDIYAHNKYIPLTDEEKDKRAERREIRRDREREKKILLQEEKGRILSEKVRKIINDEYQRGVYG